MAESGPGATAATAQPTTKGAARDRGWLVGVWLVVALFATVTAFWSDHVGVSIRDPGGQFFRGRLLTSGGLLVLFALLDACVRMRGQRWTLHNAAAVLRRRWTWQRVALALSGLLAYYLVYACYHNLKSWDAFNTPRDAFLHHVDSWLFFGHSPAVLLHDVLGQHLAAYVLAAVYESFGYLVTGSVVAALAFSNRIRDGYVFVTSAIWVWILGVTSYYLIPSLGPFASAPQDFSGLPHTVITSTQASYLTQRSQLLHHPGASEAFSSISAFASLHVGFTCMIVLSVRAAGMPRATRVLTGYLVVTMVATVYLGWHFAVDDLAGLLLGYLAVRLGTTVVYPGRRSAAPARSR